MWVLDHLDDLEADFLAIYRIEDLLTLDGPRFFRLAFRVAAYDGVIAARLREEMEQEQPPAAAPAASASSALAGPIPEGGRSRRDDLGVDGLQAVAPWLMERTEV